MVLTSFIYTNISEQIPTLNFRMFDDFYFEQVQGCKAFAVKFSGLAPSTISTAILRANGLYRSMRVDCTYQFENPTRLSLEYINNFPSLNVTLNVSPCCQGECDTCTPPLNADQIGGIITGGIFFGPIAIAFVAAIIIIFFQGLAVILKKIFTPCCSRDNRPDFENLGRMLSNCFFRPDVRMCPQCGVLVEKVGGCNNVICPFCNRTFDWRRFRRTSRCPLLSRCRLNPFTPAIPSPQPATTTQTMLPAETRANNIAECRPTATTSGGNENASAGKTGLDDWLKDNPLDNAIIEGTGSLNTGTFKICQICETRRKTHIFVECGHSFCKECIVLMMKENKLCPFDRRLIISAPVEIQFADQDSSRKVVSDDEEEQLDVV